MAKALLGHVGSSQDVRMVCELAQLRHRVHDLEDEVERLRAANAALASSVSVEEELRTLRVADKAPALA